MGSRQVGIPYEDVGNIVDAGAAHLLYGSADGITTAGNQFWHQDSYWVEGVAEKDDRFGWSLAAIAVPRPPLPPPPPPPWNKIFLPLIVDND